MTESNDKMQMVLILPYSAINVLGFGVNAFAFISNLSKEIDSSVNCTLFIDYMKGRFLLSSSFTVLVIIFLYAYLRKETFHKTNSFLYDSILFIFPDKAMSIKINNKNKNRSIVCVKLMEHAFFMLIIAYECFFFVTDSTMTSRYIIEDSTTKCGSQDEQDIKMLKVSLVFNLLLDIGNMLGIILLYIVFSFCSHKKVENLKMKNSQVVIESSIV